MNWVGFLAFYAVSAIGLAYAVGHSLITRNIREWAHGFGVWRKRLPLEPTAAVKSGSIIYEPRYHPLRWLVELVECPACLGFWIGAAAGFSQSQDLVFVLFAALFTMGSNFLLGRATGLISRPGEH